MVLFLTNLDLAHAAAQLFHKNQKEEIHCALADLSMLNGNMSVQTLFIDTPIVSINGYGDINFNREEYNLQMKSSSKKPSLVELRGPILIGGSFISPVVRPALGQPILRSSSAIILGTIFPPLALLPLIEVGNGTNKNQACRMLIQDLEKKYKKK